MLSRWFITDTDSLQSVLQYQQNLWMVALSYAVATFAAYTAFHLIARVRAATDRMTRRVWLVIAALSMGSGIWAMHFIALLAMQTPVVIRFDVLFTAGSAALAVVASALAFALVARDTRSVWRLGLAGLVLGTGIAAMQYTGMAALRLPVRLCFAPAMFSLSIAAAIALSVAALFVLTRAPQDVATKAALPRMAGALVVGLAIVLIHYSALLATYLRPVPDWHVTGMMLDPPVIAATVGGIMLLTCMLALVAAAFDMRAERTEALFRDAIDSMGPGLVIYDADDRLVACNEPYFRLFPERVATRRLGMRFEEVTRDSLARGEIPDAVGREEEWLAERLRQHREGIGQSERRLPDGRWVLITDRRMRNGGITGLRVDITALKQAQAAFAESEKRLRDFASTSSDWFWEQDAALRFLWISAETPMYWKDDKSYSGRRRDELVPHDPTDERWQQHLASLASRQPFRDFRYSRTGADGALHHISISGNPAFGSDGAFLGYRGTGRDVTPEVEAAAELRAAKERAEQAEALLRDAVDSISEGFVIYDQADRLVMCNEAYRNIYDHGADFVMQGASFTELTRRSLVRQEFADAIGNEADWLRQRLRQHRECAEGVEQHLSTGRWVLANDRHMRSGGIAGLRIDITKQKQAEARLRDSETRLDRAQAIAGVGSWELDLPTGRYFWSKELYRIRGLSPDTFEPDAGNAAPYVHPDDYPAMQHWIADLQEGGERDTIEIRIVRPDGNVRTLHVEGRAEVESDGTIRRLSGTMQDITEKRLIEQQLAQAQKMEAIGSLTGGMAHDFNNVLGVVIGNLDLLKRMLKDDPLAEELRAEAVEGAQRGAELTRRLLAFARRQPLRPQQANANALVEDIARLLSRTLGEDIELRLRLGADLPPILVDPTQLEAALTNLATNARDAMPHGGRLDITTRMTRVDAAYAAQHPEVRPGEYVLIEVSDTGTGIPKEVLGRIFEPFFTTKEMGRGSGLGLAMVFGFMKQSGGHVGVYTEVGRGSTFRLYLPPDRSAAAARTERIDETPVVGGNETILLVEDNPALRRAAVQQLAVLGYRVLEADNARSALDLLHAGAPIDLLFTDVVMPGGMDGIELAQRATEHRPGLKVLLTSGFPDVRGAEQRMNAARFHLLGKPYRHEELARMLRERLDEPAAALAGV